jgi:hypothetical protein
VFVPVRLPASQNPHCANLSSLFSFQLLAQTIAIKASTLKG